jgi:hypothetical protein
VTWWFVLSEYTLGARLAAFVVLAHDPSVPELAADWWEESAPHYRSVVEPLAELVAGLPVADDLARLAEKPTDQDREQALTGALDRWLERVPEQRRRLERLLAEAEDHVLIGYHRGPHASPAVPPIGLGDLPPRPAASRPTASRPAAGQDAPRAVRVVIPFRDSGGGGRARNLVACLASLRDQRNAAGDVTICVVESDTRCRWRETLEPWVDHYVFTEHSRHFNKSWTVNVGVRHTAGEGDLICVLDADILVDADFLARNLARMAGRPDLDAFLPYRNMFCLDVPSSDTAIRARCERGTRRVSTDEVRALLLREPPGGCLWVRAAAYDHVGGMDERYEGWGGEDDDIVARLGQAGRIERFDDRLMHLFHPRPQMLVDGRSFNGHLPPLSWDSNAAYGDPRGPLAAAR